MHEAGGNGTDIQRHEGGKKPHLKRMGAPTDPARDGKAHEHAEESQLEWRRSFKIHVGEKDIGRVQAMCPVEVAGDDGAALPTTVWMPYPLPYTTTILSRTDLRKTAMGKSFRDEKGVLEHYDIFPLFST